MAEVHATPLIEAKGLTLHAAGRCLVRNLHWRANPGERWCVIGRNAAGKSTLLRALAGLAVPQRSGDVFWLGRKQEDWMPTDAAAMRAYMPQHTSDRFAIQVQRLLELSVVNPGDLDAADVLAALDAAPLATRSVLQLSGGERQRIALAQCALQGAPLMLMDEPVAFQDPAHQLTVSRWLRSLPHATLVISAHDVNWIASTATHVLMLHGDEGRWDAGPAQETLSAERLRQAYGCAWRQVQGLWLAEQVS